MSKLIQELRRVPRLPAPSMRQAIREAAGASQEQVARELGVHRVSVWRWEKAKRTPRGPLRERYARLLEELQEVSGDER